MSVIIIHGDQALPPFQMSSDSAVFSDPSVEICCRVLRVKSLRGNKSPRRHFPYGHYRLLKRFLSLLLDTLLKPAKGPFFATLHTVEQVGLK